jgi:hypothetical protein
VAQVLDASDPAKVSYVDAVSEGWEPVGLELGLFLFTVGLLYREVTT